MNIRLKKARKYLKYSSLKIQFQVLSRVEFERQTKENWLQNNSKNLSILEF